MSRPRVALSMIVKDGMPRLEATLRALLAHIDGYLVLDTGSTDGSEEAARRLLGGLRGEVAREPFVDFAASRNRALELCEAKCDPDWIIVLDDSFVLHGGEHLGALLERVPAEVDALGITCRLAHLTFVSPKLFRASARIRFRYPVHESPDLRGKRAASLAPTVWVDDPADAGLERRTRERNVRDLDVLERYRDRDPSCSRTVFYIAQTLGRLGRFEEAIAQYRKRMTMREGYDAEIPEAARRIAMTTTYNLERPWPECEAAFLDAYERAPERADPLFHIAYHHYNDGRLRTARLFIAEAVKLAPPAIAPLGLANGLYEIDIPELGAAIAQAVNDKPLLEQCLDRVERVNPTHAVLALRRFLR